METEIRRRAPEGRHGEDHKRSRSSRSAARCAAIMTQRETLIGLGLNKIGRAAEVPWTPWQSRGMIAQGASTWCASSTGEQANGDSGDED